MRIAHVTDCYLPRLGGIELQVHDLATRQARGGHEVTVISTTGSRREILAPDEATLLRVGGRRGRPEAIRYRSSLRGRRRVDWAQFDVVHVHASSFSPLSFLVAHRASRSGIPTVATLHSLWARATPLFRAADVLTRWSAWPVEWSAVSNTAADSLRAVLGEACPVTVLPNGVTPDDWKVTPVGPNGTELRITAVMRLSSRKRPMQLAEVLLAARRRLPETVPLEVTIIGEGPEKSRLERFLRHHHMTGWVRLPGRLSRPEIRSALARSDLFVAPAQLESFGIAALEARCAGVPILAMSGTGVADFVEPGRDGWLVDCDESMADQIVAIANSRATLAGVASHNRRVAPSITWTSVLNSCEKLYLSAGRRHGLSTVGTASPGALGVAALSQ